MTKTLGWPGTTQTKYAELARELEAHRIVFEKPDSSVWRLVVVPAIDALRKADALLSVPSPQPEWLPIETAPKDARKNLEGQSAPRALCENCDGTGKVHSHNDCCWVCDGTGKVKAAPPAQPHPSQECVCPQPLVGRKPRCRLCNRQIGAGRTDVEIPPMAAQPHPETPQGEELATCIKVRNSYQEAWQRVGSALVKAGFEDDSTEAAVVSALHELALLRASQPPPEALREPILLGPCDLHDYFGSGECPDCGVRRKLAEAEARADAQTEALRALSLKCAELQEGVRTAEALAQSLARQCNAERERANHLFRTLAAAEALMAHAAAEPAPAVDDRLRQIRDRMERLPSWQHAEGGEVVNRTAALLLLSASPAPHTERTT